MSRQARLIVILAGMALLSLAVLTVVAGRYTKVIGQREGGSGQTSEQAARAAEAQVDAFVRVRLALGKTVEVGTFEDVGPAARALAFTAERDRALSAARAHHADYRELRQHFRQWVQDPAQLSGVWRDAFESRRQVLAGCHLGELEELDR